eukprot:CAMPEP_0202969058 /NCGR_PEP_ID=MMETSP1396-20130829/14648_1 /ASSEMBLY_ACC=CAM_ASM_000872 /TAXON_ID= /ORGANISM="Pseudokeronopsis sp., Strain Brazil" /LENGTH=219 /DNA_ID=CAMNT_0049696139 /DNA_START=316 /DNA_END=972 /DNA_ORIENTATION=-
MLMSLEEEGYLYSFKNEVQGRGLINLYLSSQAMMGGEVVEEEPFQKRLPDPATRHAAVPQIILANRYLTGQGVQESCRTAVMYFEEAALHTIAYVEQSHGLDVVERKKLNVGTMALQDQLHLYDQSDEKIYSDYIELLDLKSDYGSADSLTILGVQHVFGKKNVKRDFGKAKLCFEKALNIDNNHQEANYFMGFLYLHGLGVDEQFQKALSHFEKVKND